MHLVEITTNAGSDFNGLRRFEAPDVIIPLNDLARDWLDDGNDRRRRSGLGGMLSTACHQQSDRKSSNSEQAGYFHGEFNGFIAYRNRFSILRLRVRLDHPQELVHATRDAREQI